MKSLLQHRVTKTVGEWRRVLFEGVVLEAEDRHLVECLTAEPEGRMSIDQLHTGVQIQARSWVGVARFSTFEVQIVPKLVGENLGLVKMIDYATGLDSLVRYPASQDITGAGTSLFDLVALLFAEACERAIRSGLLSDYCVVEDDLPVVRGRMLIKQQVLKRFGKIDRLECRYDEYLTNIPENQILLAGLTACASRVSHPVVAMRLRRLQSIVSETCNLEGFDFREIRSTLIYNRMNEYYREPHSLAWMILDGLGIEDIYASGSQRCFAFLLDMNKLFEMFITRWFGELFLKSSFWVRPQRQDRSILWNAESSRPYKAIIPDLLIEHKNSYIAHGIDLVSCIFDRRKPSTTPCSAKQWIDKCRTSSRANPHPHSPQGCKIRPSWSIGGGCDRRSKLGISN
jgi:5-methylcytosine-specific restriction enzyme subunit McrC